MVEQENETTHFNAVNVKDDTYERFNKILREMVLKRGGQYVTQDECMREILDRAEAQVHGKKEVPA